MLGSKRSTTLMYDKTSNAHIIYYCMQLIRDVTFADMVTSSNEILFALLALCAGNSPVTGEFPSQMPVTRSFDVSLIRAWINDWVNNREAGDLRCHRTHYDVTVMKCRKSYKFRLCCWNCLFCNKSNNSEVDSAMCFSIVFKTRLLKGEVDNIQLLV